MGIQSARILEILMVIDWLMGGRGGELEVPGESQGAQPGSMDGPDQHSWCLEKERESKPGKNQWEAEELRIWWGI